MLEGAKPAMKETLILACISCKTYTSSVNKGWHCLGIQQTCCYWQKSFSSFLSSVGGNKLQGIQGLMNCVLEHMLLVTEILMSQAEAVFPPEEQAHVIDSGAPGPEQAQESSLLMWDSSTNRPLHVYSVEYGYVTIRTHDHGAHREPLLSWLASGRTGDRTGCSCCVDKGKLQV